MLNLMVYLEKYLNQLSRLNFTWHDLFIGYNLGIIQRHLAPNQFDKKSLEGLLILLNIIFYLIITLRKMLDFIYKLGNLLSIK